MQHVPGLLVLLGHLGQARGLAVAQLLERKVDQLQRQLGFLVAALGALLDLNATALQALEVGQHQLGFDDLEVRNGVDAVLDVGDVVIDEAARDKGHGVAVADVGQELVAQALALGRAAHQTGHVDEGDPRGDDFLRPGDLRQGVQTRLRDRHVAGVRLDGAERIVGGLSRRRLGQGVEQGGLADVGQADDRDFKSHGIPREREPLAGSGLFVRCGDEQQILSFWERA
ncbi:hypothetical protein D3C72_1556070 [compost metagenome]